MRIPTSISAATVVVAAATLGLTGATGASAAPPTCADLTGELVGQTCQIRATDPAYTLSIDYPIDYPDETAVTDYVKQTRDGFINVAKMPGFRFMPYELDTTVTGYGSGIPPRGTRSVVFKTYQSIGGAHPSTFYESFNWDRGSSKPITIDDLFREGTQPFPVILPLVQAEVDKQLGQPIAIPAGTGLDPTKYENFAITDDAIVFFFSQGDLLPESSGALEVSVPRAPIASMIA